MPKQRWRLMLTVAVAAVAVAAGLLAGCASSPGARPRAVGGRVNGAAGAAANAAANPTGTASAEIAAATGQVVAAETAFAKSMADRNLENFLSFLSLDAIFFNGSSVEHGRGQIAQVWAPYFAGPRAPFSWKPDHVEVLPDGKLALSTGPLMQDGQVVGRFDSIWRLEAPNTWHIVFDKGEPVCSVSAGGTGGAG